MHIVSCVLQSIAVIICSQLLPLCSSALCPNINITNLSSKVVNKERTSTTTSQSGQSEPILDPSIESFQNVTFESIATKGNPNGKYKSLSVLGRGAKSVVYDGRVRANTGGEVAIKKLCMPYKNSHEWLKMVKREACVLKYCKGAKYIIQFVEAFDETEIVWLVTELVPRGNLSPYTYHVKDLEKRKQLDAKVFPTLFFNLIKAIKFLHDRGMIHRDIKPDNIYVGNDCFVLGDFGFCTEPNFSYKWPTKVYGTMLYIAPEVYQGEYNEKVDVWSLGISILSLLVDPFPGWEDMNGRPEFFQKLMQYKGPWQSNIVDKCSGKFQDAFNMLQPMLKFDPNERSSADDLLEKSYLETRLSDEEIKEYFEANK